MVSPRRVIIYGLFLGLCASARADEPAYPAPPQYSADQAQADASSSTATVPSLPPSQPAPEPVPRRKPKPDPYYYYGYDDGAFTVKPSLEIGLIASDNANLTSGNPQVGLGLELKPTLTFASEWPVHQWTGSFNLDWVQFTNSPNGASLTGTAQTNFRLDIERNSHADFGAYVTISQANVGSAQVPSTATAPQNNWVFGATADIDQDFGRWEGLARLTITRAAYGDVPLSGGGTFSNADLNFIEPAISARAIYGAPRDILRPYVELGFDPRVHDTSPDRSGYQRNSLGYEAAAGLIFADTPFWQGDIAISGLLRNYADSRLPLAMTVGPVGSLTYSPTRRLNFTATVSTSLSETYFSNMAALNGWTAGLSGTYSVRDNIDVKSAMNVGLQNNGLGYDVTDVASIGAEWKFNPKFSAAATLQNTWFFSSVNPNYNEQRATISVILRP